MSVRNPLLVLVMILAPVLASANMGGSDSDEDGGDVLEQARERIEAGEYRAALDQLEALEAEQSDDADVYNLLGYSHRKLEQYERAERYYQRALSIDPEHRGANEYLGELYLQTDRPELARERLQVLDDACFFGCEEYDELEAAIREYERKSD